MNSTSNKKKKAGTHFICKDVFGSDAHIEITKDHTRTNLESLNAVREQLESHKRLFVKAGALIKTDPKKNTEELFIPD